MSRFVFDRAPRRVYWELTRACDLACRHCRAQAIPSRDPRELSRSQAMAFLAGLRDFGGVLVMTGGDPLKRPDFWDLLSHAVALGLEVAVAPSATAGLTPAVVRRLARRGVTAMSLSLDGAETDRHDAFRGVPGSYETTLRAALAAEEEGLALQINTLVAAETLADLPAVAERVARLGARRWSLFFLIPVGRGRGLGQVSPEACEGLLGWLADLSDRAPFTPTTTEAPHYRRVLLQRRVASPGARHGFGIRDGNGIMLVSHRGDVQPSGFLPLVAGNVRTRDPVAIYREAPLFRALRKPAGFRGRCGRCEFREVCGGSRARAYAATGDPLAEDPLCVYEPGGAPWTSMVC